jgi:hypothetical protein
MCAASGGSSAYPVARTIGKSGKPVLISAINCIPVMRGIAGSLMTRSIPVLAAVAAPVALDPDAGSPLPVCAKISPPA